jgi:hypothetical protein
MMRRSISLAGLVALAWPLCSLADEPPVPSRELPRATAPPVIGAQQIDRYDAINSLQNELKANPKSLADWIILGELAHEVAIDAPADQAPRYFTMSRDAYEKALALAPSNVGLKAAVQFARDQEANGAAFEKIRDRATQAYLDARRRDLAATNYAPSVRVFAPPGPAPVLRPQPAAPAGTVLGATSATSTDPNAAVTQPPAVVRDTANMGVRQIYSSAPTYQAYTLPQGAPYTFQQYSNSYYSPSYYPAGTLPMSVQRYNQMYGNPVLNPLGPQVLPGTVVPGTVVPGAVIPRR